MSNADTIKALDGINKALSAIAKLLEITRATVELWALSLKIEEMQEGEAAKKEEWS